MAFFGMGIGKKDVLPSEKDALPGRDKEMSLQSTKHYVNGNLIKGDFPEGREMAMFGLAAFGVRSVSFGRLRACTVRRLAMRRALHQTLPTEKFALG